MKRDEIKREIERRNGVLNLLPAWVARKYLLPGKRLKLSLQDLYAYGAHRGALTERWLASTGMADNGDLTYPNEGLSFVSVSDDQGRVLFKDCIEIAGDEILGQDIMSRYGGLTAFAKLFDFQTPIGHHVHLMEKDCQWLKVSPKPEAYYFPPQMNNSFDYRCAHTYFGVIPGTTKQDLARCLRDWAEHGDNGILELSHAYKLRIGTGWDVPAGILHAPGTLVTYEPQRVSDTSLFWQSVIHDMVVDQNLSNRFVRDEQKTDYDAIAEMIDWESNSVPDFKKQHYHEPIPLCSEEEAVEQGFMEKWVAYGSPEFSAKELTVLPGRTVTIRDSLAYGLIMMDGYGTINGQPIETPTIIHYGKCTADEMFVTRNAASEGVTIINRSPCQELVMLKHFGPGNPDAENLFSAC